MDHFVVYLKLTQHRKSTILQLKQKSKWIDCIFTMECSMLMRIKELQLHATTWMNLKSKMLSKGSQAHMRTDCI